MAQQIDYANLPASPPPPGVLPNFDSPPMRDTEIYVGMSILIGITIVFVTLRVYIKLVITHMWGWDDGAQSSEPSKIEADGGSGLPARICKDGECLLSLVDLISSMTGTYHCLRYRCVHQ